MKTITFYSYKGGAGRSLALANASVYLAALGFRVIALDFDLEAPGLHYKLSRKEDGSPLDVQKGLVDYVNAYCLEGQVNLPLKDFIVDVPVPGVERSLVRLLPAGRVPSSDYWSKLARINWHDLFYAKGAKGVQIFMELKARIFDELKPDFLLVDARTGITEMGGVATTLFADKIVCLVLPTAENMQGARAVLRSVRRSRRETDAADPEIMIAVSRLPQRKDIEDESELTHRILTQMNMESDDPEDTLKCQTVFVLHSELALQIRESLRVGSGINPDDSVLLRDYLRLFASFVPKGLIEPKVHDLIEKAWETLRTEPDVAVKDMEELAESFGHPETYRELLHFYQVRNVGGTLTLKRAQRLWELTGDASDPILWRAIVRSFEALPRYRRDDQWSPNLDFVRAVWRDAGGKNPTLGMKLADAYYLEDHESLAADVLLEIVNSSEPTAAVVARCIELLDAAKRMDETEVLIQGFKSRFSGVPEFALAWARRTIKGKNDKALAELTRSPWAENVRPALRALLYFKAGLTEEATATAGSALTDLQERKLSRSELEGLKAYFHSIGRSEEFESAVSDVYPEEVLKELRGRPRFRIRRR